MSDHSHHDGIRKRVCKACDRCRLKKSKCDGLDPCLRCQADNTPCVFGQRKKPHEKAYPKGYAEMLEQQQVWLVQGLQELYRRNIEGQGWPGKPLKPEANGLPLTHDLLTHLGALGDKQSPSLDIRKFCTEKLEPENDHSPHNSPVTPSIISSTDFTQQAMPSTPTSITLDSSNMKFFDNGSMHQESYLDPPRPGVSDTWEFQDTSQWFTQDPGLFDDMSIMADARNCNLFSGDPFLYENLDIFSDLNAAGLTLS